MFMHAKVESMDMSGSIQTSLNRETRSALRLYMAGVFLSTFMTVIYYRYQDLNSDLE